MTGLPNGLANVVFAYKTRVETGNFTPRRYVLQEVKLSQTPTLDFQATVDANAYITSMKFVNIKSKGTYNPLQASRTISYNVPIGFVQAQGSGKSKFTGRFDSNQELIDHWFSGSGELGTHEIAAVNSNNALHVKSTYNVTTFFGLTLVSRQSLISLNWSSTGVNLNQSWSMADHLLSYDTQTKIRVNSQSYYMAGLIFRVDASGQSYGVSYLRANTGTSGFFGSDSDGIPDEVCPVNKQAMIVLWQEKPVNTVQWLAYKTLATTDGVVDSNGYLVDWSTLLVRVIEADSLQFDQGGPGTTGTLRSGDIITGATSGATATVNGTPILTSGDWATHDAAGWLTVTNVTKTSGVIQFQSGENLTVAGVVRARYTGTSRQKDNYIRVYYGNTAGIGTANSSPLGNNRSGDARLATGDVTWPVDDVADWAVANDNLTLVPWDNNLNLGAGDARLGTGSELNAIYRTNALPSPASGTFTQPEIGLDTWGNSSTSVYFDDFGLQASTPGQTQGFLPAIQQ
jgi:hypothetical protein